eukprot:TRINITY_DN779818_c0_g1_i1.p1 TRINITY_DN779818_c0_g1~~TRINITY_DN779818_c0_g1_i1.p1  ORF type:complete len:437 (-),score=161.77 TRINITY_DN779818_c0_g1_i1:457-1767(-)
MYLRASVVKHTFAESAKPGELFTGIPLAFGMGDHSFIKANSKRFAIAVRGGGGPLLVHNFDKPGKVAPGFPVIQGHSSKVTDFDFNPFNDNMIVTGSDDRSVKIWIVPEEGLKENMTEPVGVLEGHAKPVTFVQFHPTASNILATAGKDCIVNIWNIEDTEAPQITLGPFPSMVQDLKWNHDGSILAISTKDKKLTFWDVRKKEVIKELQAHEGSKCVKMCWLGERDMFATTGFSRDAKRQIRIWRYSDLERLVHKELDQSSCVLFPFFDEGCKMLYLAGKGDSSVKNFEVVDASPFIYEIGECRTAKPQNGICMMPNYALDVMKCEIARFVKLTREGVEHVSMRIPRRDEGFQADLYPDCIAPIPSLTAAQWLEGGDEKPKMVSMDPSKGGVKRSGAEATFKPKKTAAQLEKELDVANARIKELEEKLAKFEAVE